MNQVFPAIINAQREKVNYINKICLSAISKYLQTIQISLSLIILVHTTLQTTSREAKPRIPNVYLYITVLSEQQVEKKPAHHLARKKRP